MRVALPNGIEGVATAIDRHTLRIEAPSPYAPGTPIELRLTLPDRELVAQAKVTGVKKNDEGRFELRLRLLGLRRADLEAIAKKLPR